MLVVAVKEGESIEKALKKFKKKFEKTGVVKQLRARKQFTKPSVRRREEIIKTDRTAHAEPRPVPQPGDEPPEPFSVLTKAITCTPAMSKLYHPSPRVPAPKTWRYFSARWWG